MFINRSMQGVLSAICCTAIRVAAEGIPEEPASSVVRGDLNRDGTASLLDIEAFVLAHHDSIEWMQRYGADAAALLALADFSNDGQLGPEDVAGFGAVIAAPLERVYQARAQATQAALDVLSLVSGIPTDLRSLIVPCPPVPPPLANLHADGDNTSGFLVPDRSAAEEAQEPPTVGTGKLISLHEGAKRVPLILEVAPTTSVAYGEGLIWYIAYGTKVRLWRHPVSGIWPADGFLSVAPGGQTPTYTHRWWYHGDMNGDGCIGTSDISPFIMAITYPNDYIAQYVNAPPNVPFPAAGDFDGSLSCTVGDISGFTAVVTGGIQRPAPVYLWLEPLGPTSSVAGDVLITSYADADDDGVFFPADAGDVLPDQVQCTLQVDLGAPRPWAGMVELNRFSMLDLRSGNVFTKIPVSGFKGTGPEISFSVFHNSMESVTATEWNPFCRSIAEGPHVRWGYSAHVQGVDGNSTVTVVYDDGSTDLFRRNSSPGSSGRFYDPPAGVYSDLRWDPSFKQSLDDAVLGAWVLTTRDQTKRYFVNSTCGVLHELVRVVDAAGNPMRVWLHPIPAGSSGPEHKLEGTTVLLQPLEQIAEDDAGFCGQGGPPGGSLSLWFKVFEGAPCTTPETALHCPGVQRYPQQLLVHAGVPTSNRWFVEYVNAGGQSELWVYPSWVGWSPVGVTQPIILRFDPSGRIETLSDMDGRQWSYFYDSVGRLEAVVDPGTTFDQTFTYTRSSTGVTQVQVTDRRDYVSTYEMDSVGNVTSVTTPLPGPNNVRRFEYDLNHNLTATIDELNHRWAFTYTPLGALVTVSSPLTGADAQTWTFAHALAPSSLWNFERLNRITDPLGDWTDLLYTWNAYTPPDPTAPAAIRDSMATASQATVLKYHATSHGTFCGPAALRGLLSEVLDMNNGRHLFEYSARGFLSREDGGVPIGVERALGPTPFNGTEQHNGRGWPEQESNDMAHVGSPMGHTPNGGTANGGGCKNSTDGGGGGRVAYPFAGRLGTAPAPAHAPCRPCCATNQFDAIDRLIQSRNDYDKDTYIGPANDWDEHDFGFKDVQFRDDYFTYEPALARLLTFTRTLNDKRTYNGEVLLLRPFTFYYNQTSLGEPREVSPTRITGPDGAVREYRRVSGKLGFDPLGRPHTVEHGSVALGEAVVKYTYDAAGRVTREDFGDSAAGGAIVRSYDDADRLTAIEHLNGADQLLLRIAYVWRRDNTVQSRTETDYTTSRTSVVNFEYDGRKQLTREHRVENAVAVYDLRYTYDPVGNRLTKHDLISHYKTLYFYDVDDDRTVPSDPRGAFTLDYSLATADNRLIYYKDYDADGAVLLRTVKYTYYKLGHASNVTVKDEGDPWHYNVNLYYFSNGQLWRALWDKWKIDGPTGLVDDYAVLDNNTTDANALYYPREFYYDGNGARRLTRRMIVELTCCSHSTAGGETCWPNEHRACTPTDLDDPGELPMTFKWLVARNGSFKHDFGADMLGLIPWSEFQAHLDDVNGNGRDDEDRIFPVASYLSDGRVQSRLPAGGNPEYLHGDLTHSTMLRTNPVGGAIPGTGGPGGGDGAAVLGYTAFGEPIVRNGGTGVPPSIGGRVPAAMHRYAYVGGLGYEQDTLVLAGSASSPLPPITLSHVGQRWYQPGVGRWAQRDPIGIWGGQNVYAYAENQPLTLVDPEGKCYLSLQGGSVLQLIPHAAAQMALRGIALPAVIRTIESGKAYFDTVKNNLAFFADRTYVAVSLTTNQIVTCIDRSRPLTDRWIPLP